MITPSPPRLPPNVPPEVRGYLTELNKFITRELTSRTPDTYPNSVIPLVSPNGTVYNISVTDAGVITATKVFG